MPSRILLAALLSLSALIGAGPASVLDDAKPAYSCGLFVKDGDKDAAEPNSVPAGVHHDTAGKWKVEACTAGAGFLPPVTALPTTVSTTGGGTGVTGTTGPAVPPVKLTGAREAPKKGRTLSLKLTASEKITGTGPAPREGAGPAALSGRRRAVVVACRRASARFLHERA